MDTKQQVSEIWVWVPKASRKITIKHPQLGQLRDYFFPTEIEAERTYEMVLTMQGADVYVDNAMIGKAPCKSGPMSSGQHMVRIVLGKGVYKIECKQANHETTMVSKEISTEMSRQTIDLPSPRPIYGSLNVESTPKISKLFIDG